MRWGCYLVCKALWFVRYYGRENIPDESKGSFLIAGNHQTYLDPVWICLPIRRPMRFMAWDEAFNWPVIGPIIAYLGAFPVSMEIGGTLKALKQSLRILRSGGALTVFPEGERGRMDGRLRVFKPGVIRIASQAGVPILPVTIRGGNRVWPQQKKYPRFFQRVEVIYHPLMYLPAHEEIDAREEYDKLNEELRDMIASGLPGENNKLLEGEQAADQV